MTIDHMIKEINKGYKWEHIARVNGYEKEFGILDESGVVVKLITDSQLEDYYRDLVIIWEEIEG